MLYDSMFSWGDILQAFWRDTAAFVEAQERQNQQDCAYWMELWDTLVHNLTSGGHLPWTGAMEPGQWSQAGVARDAASRAVRGGELSGGQYTEILDRFGQLERQINGVEERLALLTEHGQRARRKGRGKATPRRRPSPAP